MRFLDARCTTLNEQIKTWHKNAELQKLGGTLARGISLTPTLQRVSIFSAVPGSRASAEAPGLSRPSLSRPSASGSLPGLGAVPGGGGQDSMGSQEVPAATERSMHRLLTRSKSFLGAPGGRWNAIGELDRLLMQEKVGHFRICRSLAAFSAVPPGIITLRLNWLG